VGRGWGGEGDLETGTKIAAMPWDTQGCHLGLKQWGFQDLFHKV